MATGFLACPCLRAVVCASGRRGARVYTGGCRHASAPRVQAPAREVLLLSPLERPPRESPAGTLPHPVDASSLTPVASIRPICDPLSTSSAGHHDRFCSPGGQWREALICLPARNQCVIPPLPGEVRGWARQKKQEGTPSHTLSRFLLDVEFHFPSYSLFPSFMSLAFFVP